MITGAIYETKHQHFGGRFTLIGSNAAWAGSSCDDQGSIDDATVGQILRSSQAVGMKMLRECEFRV
jgi:hypothetical protein